MWGLEPCTCRQTAMFQMFTRGLKHHGREADHMQEELEGVQDRCTCSVHNEIRNYHHKYQEEGTVTEEWMHQDT